MNQQPELIFYVGLTIQIVGAIFLLIFDWAKFLVAGALVGNSLILHLERSGVDWRSREELRKYFSKITGGNKHEYR